MDSLCLLNALLPPHNFMVDDATRYLMGRFDVRIPLHMIVGYA